MAFPRNLSHTPKPFQNPFQENSQVILSPNPSYAKKWSLNRFSQVWAFKAPPLFIDVHSRGLLWYGLVSKDLHISNYLSNFRDFGSKVGVVACLGIQDSASFKLFLLAMYPSLGCQKNNPKVHFCQGGSDNRMNIFRQT